MIPSVQERKKNIDSFMSSYPDLCRLQNIVPNPSIKINSSNKCLDFIGDRLKLEDWKPVLEAISNDRSLRFIRIRSRHSKVKVALDADAESQPQQINNPKLSPLCTNNILVRISESLSKCLSNSLALTGLLLEKIPLNAQCLNYLTQGLEVCHNLQQLSLPYTQLGDDGCATLCHVLRHRLNLIWLDLTGCGLTENGVSSLCNLLKFQKLNRYGESWKQSLRYRPVNPNIMPGLRRLTLNHNPIGDSGVRIFVDTLVDDLWLKALDLQHCEITSVGGENLLNLVKDNEFLSVVDVRGNLRVPKGLAAEIVQQLAMNNKGATPEFQWLPEDNPNVSSKRSNSATTVSRSTHRLLSNTTLASAVSVLPNKARVPRPSQPHIHYNTSARSTPAKRTLSANNSSRRPWNWNSASNHSLKRENSCHVITANRKLSEDNIMLELHLLKDQLHEVEQKLEEERERRVKLENELEVYKQLISVMQNANHDKSAFQDLFDKFYSAYITKQPKEQLSSDCNKEEVKIQANDNMDYVIRAINEDNPLPVIKQDSNKGDSASVCSLKSSAFEGNGKIHSNKAQEIFETLLCN